MQYIHRSLERKFMSMSAAFKAVMVVGARQVGKSTMLKYLAQGENRTVVSMDDARVRELAQNDPALFFQAYRPPLLIDEIQKAPQLLEQIKIICDNTDQCGLFWLTGSQSRKLLQQAGDSLSGRVCILKMFSLSQSEKIGITDVFDMDFSFSALLSRQQRFPPNCLPEVFGHIWRGGMPAVRELEPEQLSEYFNSYIETYLMRDAVDDNGIKDTVGFRKLLRACAAFSGELLNYNDLATAADISMPTAKEWVKVLENMGIIYLLEPYSNNELKRLIKKPKLYFCDTGLCAYISMWTSRDTLMGGAAAGHYFENYVVGEIMRSCAYGKERTNLTFYRDSNQREIDLLIEAGNGIHPLEIKKSANPDKRAVKGFGVLNKAAVPVGKGGIACMVDSPFPIDEANCLIPSNLL